MSAPLLSSVVLGLAWFAAIDVVAAGAAWVAAPWVLRGRMGRRGGVLLALRLFPAAFSLFFAAAVFAPAHWRLEPAESNESFGLVVCGLSVLGAALLLRGAGRVAVVARAGWQLRACRRCERVDPALGIYEVPGLAGVSLAGVFHTRILVGTAVRGALTAGELDVALAHERAHRVSLDNLKRALMFCAPDLFGACAASQDVEQRWRAAAEWDADARAIDGDGLRAVHLASALVKVSRLAAGPSRIALSPAWSTLHDPPLLEMRVRRLVQAELPRPVPRRGFRKGASVALVATILAGCAAMASPLVHVLTEALVQLLP